MNDVTEQAVSSKADERFNGWSNYETWLVALWLDNDRAGYNMLAALKAEPGNVYDKAEWLEELTRELYELDTVGIVTDFVNAAFARVNWVEVLEN